MTNRTVSVIIPTFNRSSLLERAIDSVTEQTYENLEILVVDDASRDDTESIVRNLEDNRIRYIRHSENLGGAATRNTGIEAAAGRYIAFLDDDDRWDPRKTEAQLDALKDFDAVICTSDRQLENLKQYADKTTVDLDDLKKGMFTWGGTGALMAHAHVLKETMFDESLRKNQDWDLFIEIAKKFKIAYLNKPYVIYNEGDHERITNRNRSLSVEELERQLTMLHKHKDFFGNVWFKRHMARALMYRIGSRRDKLRVLTYTARRYGIVNVARIFAIRADYLVRGKLGLREKE